ncbi:hypothetical protein DPX16_13968 [Anabarilius grahami]|uniref:Integrase catalytic domain-containing protein n=1 Tax=Anabarilius grahami TaxID=495550 RepID=A0A3N0Y9F9_ANAGA|nr:hypothetical protein DPX16_13968 [Anabarilius grahami]
MCPCLDTLKKLCSTTYLVLRTIKTTAQSISHVMGSLVVLDCHLWLTLTDLKDSDKVVLLDTPIFNGWPPSIKGQDVELLPYYKLRLELSVKDNFTFRSSQLIVPAALRFASLSIVENPLSIVTDNGVQFTSAAFSAFLEGRNICHHCSSLYYLAANGAVERFDCVLKHTVQMCIQQYQPWKPVVTDFLQVYQATPYAATGTSPFQLLYGRQIHTSLSI